MPIVEIDLVGTVEFPDSMSEADISTAAEQLYTERQRATPAMQPEGPGTRLSPAAATEAAGQLDRWLRPAPQPRVDADAVNQVGRAYESAISLARSSGRRDSVPKLEAERRERLKELGVVSLDQPEASLVEPLVALRDRVPKAQTVQDAVDVLASYAGGTDEEKDYLRAGPSAPPDKTAQGVSGGLRAVAGAGEFLTSPLGVATMGTAAAPQWVQKLTTMGFTADMLRHTPELATRFGEASVSGDTGEQVEALGDLLLNSAFIVSGASHSLPRSAPPPAKVTLARTLARQLLREEVAGRTMAETAPAIEARSAGAASVPPAATTFPEAFETMRAQFDLLEQGKRSAVLVTAGETVPALPKGVATHETPAGLFVYDPARVQPETLNQAVAENRVGDVLEYGIPAKPAPGTEVGAMVVRDSAGTEVQAVVTDKQSLPAVFDAAQRVKPAEGSVTLEPAAQVIEGRAKAQAAGGESGQRHRLNVTPLMEALAGQKMESLNQWLRGLPDDVLTALNDRQAEWVNRQERETIAETGDVRRAMVVMLNEGQHQQVALAGEVGRRQKQGAKAPPIENLPPATEITGSNVQKGTEMPAEMGEGTVGAPSPVPAAWKAVVAASALSETQKLQLARDVESLVAAKTEAQDFYKLWKSPRGRKLNAGERAWNKAVSDVADLVYGKNASGYAKPKVMAPANPDNPVEKSVAKVAEHVEAVASGRKKAKPEPDLSTTSGPRAAKEIKSELVERIDGEIDALLKKAGVVLNERRHEGGEVDFLASSEARWAKGAIEPRKNKFSVVAQFYEGKGKELVTRRALVESVEAAKRFIQAHAAVGEGKVTIRIPGDGTFTIDRSGDKLFEVWKRARSLDTKSRTSASTTGHRPGIDDLDELVRGLTRAYGTPRAAYEAVRRQNAGVDAEYLREAGLDDAALRKAVEAEAALYDRLPEVVARRRVEALEKAVQNRQERIDANELEIAKDREFLNGLKGLPAAERGGEKHVKRGLEAKVNATAKLRHDLAKEQADLDRAREARAAAEREVNPAKGNAQGMPATRVTGQELPSGDGGGAKRRPPVPDDPEFTAFPVDLPEAVRFARDLMGGKYPRVVEGIRLLGGQALGVFRSIKGQPDSGRIDLRADIADLLTREDKARLRAEAQEWARQHAEPGDNPGKLAEERYRFLENEAYEAAKTQPPVLALKVLWHEIGHAVDFLPEAMIRGRGNLFGRIASLKDYLKHTLARDPNKPAGEPLTSRERAELRREAEAILREEMGPILETVETVLVEEPVLRVVGITPEMVKRLINSNGAREEMPTLYRWFAEQPAAVKKEVIRKAMRDVLDERLAALGESQVVGTKTTERTVRRKVGREPTPQELEAAFRKAFEEELKRRNLAELATVKRELESTIAWWRGTEKMEDYFKTGSEMYAEAFSIFLNNPAALQKRAPTYARLLWNYLDRKPEAKRLYDSIQNEIKAGAARDISEKQMLDSWDAADVQSLESLRDSWKRVSRDTLDNVSYHMDRRFGPIYRAAKGAVSEGRVREAVGNFLYRATEHELYLGRLNRAVGEKLVGANLDWKDLGRYLFYQRVINERFKIFNPYGVAPNRAIERLANMRQTMGEPAWLALEAAANEYRALYQQHVVQAIGEARMFNPELQTAIERNVDYATFDVRQNKPKDGLETLLESTFGANVTPHIYRQVGTVKEIKNPATATVLKGLSLISAAARNTAKRETVRMLMEQDPGNILPAQQRWTGKYMEPIIRDTDGVGTVIYLQDGKPQAFYVKKHVADALNKGNSIENALALRAVQAVGWLKGLYTQLNYAFWPVNFVKDSVGWVMQMPSATPLDWARLVPQSIKAARDSVKGRANPAAEDVLRRKMVISRADPRGVWAAVENEFELKLASYGLNPAQWAKEADRVHGVVRAWNSYRELGQTFERVNKISAMRYLDEKFPTMPEWKKREIVRERGGSPDFLQRGASNPYVDFFAMFYNPWKESIRSVAKSARENPVSFAAKSTAFIVAPTVLQAMASAGAFGDDIEDQMRSVPDYDLSNYLVIPLGWQDKKQKTVAYLRLPLWEPARLLHGSLWQTITGRGRGLLSFAGGQVPGINPLVSTAHDWAQFEVFNHNPYESFRGQSLLDDTTFQAAGWEARKELLKHTWNQMGGSIVHRFRNDQLESPPETEMQEFLALPIINNALGRWVKVSNRGRADEDKRLTADLEQHRAQIRVGVREVMRKVSAGEALVDSERMLMREPYALEYFMRTMPDVVEGQSSELLRRLHAAQSKEARTIILTNELRRQTHQPVAPNN